MRTTDNLPRYVVDASVATKWHLRDEQHTTQADMLLAGFRDGRWNFSAPESLRYEVAGAIRKAVRMNRLTRGQGRRAIAGFLIWRIPVVESDTLLLAAYDYSWRFGCSLRRVVSRVVGLAELPTDLCRPPAAKRAWGAVPTRRLARGLGARARRRRAKHVTVLPVLTQGDALP
jgi:predicted nucleic acid-binding protein